MIHLWSCCYLRGTDLEHTYETLPLSSKKSFTPTVKSVVCGTAAIFLNDGYSPIRWSKHHGQSEFLKIWLPFLCFRRLPFTVGFNFTSPSRLDPSKKILWKCEGVVKTIKSKPRAGGLGVFALHDVPSRRFTPRFVYFEAPGWILWLRDPFPAWGASVSDRHW